MPLHTHRPFAPTQYIRIFVIVHLTTFFITRSVLESQLRQQRKSITTPQSSPRTTFTQPSRPVTTSDRPAEGADHLTMPKPKTENTKKAAGNARKAEAAAQKQAVADSAAERAEADKWSKGAKSDSKKQSAEEKKQAQAAAKAERDRILAEEEASQPSKPKGAGKKTAEKKSKGTLDLSQLEAGSNKERTLNASGIDNALDALTLTSNSNNMKIDRHPERRFAAAYKAFEERRLPEVKQENPGLRRNQMIEQIRKEFEK
jgi:membrane protein involved in colicin uptake